MLKILQARLQQYVNYELPDVQVGFRNSRGTRDQIANICWIVKKAREFQKNIYFCFIDCVHHHKLWKIPKEMEITDHLTCLLRNLCGRKEQLELDMEQHISSKSGMEYVKAVYCHPVYLTYMQNTSCKIPGEMNHKLESTMSGEISVTSDMQMTRSFWQKAKKK